MNHTKHDQTCENMVKKKVNENKKKRVDKPMSMNEKTCARKRKEMKEKILIENDQECKALSTYVLGLSFHIGLSNALHLIIFFDS